jgi:hypothetical protein
MKTLKPTETQLVKAILTYLKASGITAWRVNGVARVGRGGRPIRSGPRGQADITGLLPDGRRLDIEVKLPGNQPTPEQWAFLLQMQRSGGVAFWVDSLELVQEAMPFLRQGAWVVTETTFNGALSQGVCDNPRWRTNDRVRPPTPPRSKARSRRKGR